MSKHEAIFVFTKDRPETLKETIASIKNAGYAIYIIDDSTNQANQHSVIDVSRQYSNCHYLGKKQFQEFTTRNNIEFPKFNFLLREVGNIEWNLGYTRNFALLYSKSIGLERVLFTDDDIRVPNPSLITEIFQSINDYKFSGANILGLVDDSVLGHIATDVGVINERMLSGGFMAFNPNTIQHYFLNNYNEDWIWLFLQTKKNNYLQKGEVYQALSNPLKNYKDRILFQEFGEIALDGILDLYTKSSFENLNSLEFWQRIISERAVYLNTLNELSLKENKRDNAEIIEFVKINFHTFTANAFKNLFEKYSSDKIIFHALYDSLP